MFPNFFDQLEPLSSEAFSVPLFPKPVLLHQALVFYYITTVLHHLQR